MTERVSGMKRLIIFLFCALSTALWAEGGVFTADDFTLSRFAKFEDGVCIVKIPEKKNIANDTRGISLKNTAALAGKAVRFSAEVRYFGIGSDTKGQHVGGKILLVCRNSAGVPTYYSSQTLLGTNDQWQKLTAFCAFPSDMQKAAVVFGIQQAWGTMEFRNIAWEVIEQKLNYSIPGDFRCEYSEAVAARPMMRGVMSPAQNQIQKKDIRDLKDWNVNLMRYQLVGGISNEEIQNIDVYGKWLDGCLDKLEKLLPVFEEAGVQVIIDMHRVPGGRYRESGLLGTAGEAAAKAYGNKARFLLMDETAYREAFLNAWKKIAKRFKGNPQIYGYDLMNEPDQIGLAKYHWLDLQYDAAKLIREIDPETPIIIESNNWSSPVTFCDIKPMPLKNMIYQFHMYFPGEYTHQGVNNKKYAATYPAEAWDYRDRGWTAEKLEQAVWPVVKFQQKYGAKVFVGEFSAPIWAPGAANYLKDVIDIFEKHHWDWTYHAYREWAGWSVEHEGTPSDMYPAENTDRKQVLLDFFKKNPKQ